jgi:type II secretory pathway component GspD/PulD (secretin)
MKLLAASILITLTLGAGLAFKPAPYDSCSCTADDGTCTTTISCRGGCLSWCPTDGCIAQCLSGPGSRIGVTVNSVTLHLRDSRATQVSDELARVTGQEVVFSPATPDTTVTLDADNTPIWDVLETLSRSGRIQISGIDFYNIKAVRRTLLNGEPIAVCAHGMTVKRFVNELRFMTGLDVQVTSGDANAIVNYNGHGVYLNDIMSEVSERTGTQIGFK